MTLHQIATLVTSRRRYGTCTRCGFRIRVCTSQVVQNYPYYHSHNNGARRLSTATDQCEGTYVEARDIGPNP